MSYDNGQEDVSPQTDRSPAPDAAAAAKVSPLRRRGVRIAIIVAVVALLAAGLAWYVDHERRGKFLQSTNDAFIQADSVIVAPKVAGYVDRVFVAENAVVKAGQPLVQIDPRDYRAQAAQITAQIDVARANVQGVRAQIDEQRAAVVRAQAGVAQAESAVAFAAAEVARYEPLAASGAETRQQLSQLRNQLRQARAELAARRAELLGARRRIGSLEAQANQARSQGEAAEAQLQSANVNVRSTIVRASIAGRVGDQTARVGQFVQPGTRMMTIVPVDQIYVEANFKETQVGLMRVGQPATVEVDALPGVELHGRVASFAPGTGAQFSVLPPQNATGNFTKIVQRIPVRIAIDAGPETRQLLVPGMSVEVTVDTRSARDAAERIEREQEAREKARR